MKWKRSNYPSLLTTSWPFLPSGVHKLQVELLFKTQISEIIDYLIGCSEKQVIIGYHIS